MDRLCNVRVAPATRFRVEVNMRRTRRLRGVLLATGIATLVMTGSYSVAGATVISYHGDDYTYDYNSRHYIANCDQESDSNHTKGGYAFQTTGGEFGHVEDSDGANGICATANDPVYQYIRHRTCEKNLLDWDCGNWQAT
jgi:hypothetical protein